MKQSLSTSTPFFLYCLHLSKILNLSFFLLLILLDIDGKGGKEEDEAQKIYREIIEVVSSASPASLQAVRGRMVGYGEEAGATLRRAARGRQERPGENRGPPGGRHR